MDASFFIGSWGTGFTAYIVLQALAALLLRDSHHRRIALLPALPMLAVFLWTIHAYHIESNLWPLVLIFASPVAAIAVGVIGVVMWLDERRKRRPSSENSL